MNKQKHVHICQNCGYQSIRWLGKCPECHSWDSFEEQAVSDKKTGSRKIAPGKAVPLHELNIQPPDRLSTGINELDNVLGGGIVPGSMVMVGGDPGIGKSTLMLQLVHTIRSESKRLYISGEESLHQIRQRARRLDIENDRIFFLNETYLESVTELIENENPAVAIIDSVQTVQSEQVDGIPGYTSQLRYCTSELMRTAKKNGIPIFIIGHVTKDGSIAGPKILEHLVDTVLYFEGDQQQYFRILRATKNRFGPINEIAIFQMERRGLVPVENPSHLFIAQDSEDRQGSAIVAVMEGNRPVLAEVQALVSRTQFGTPQRTAMGIDHRRMNLLLAVLEKKCGKPFGFNDVFIKTAAGLRIDEPTADLGICMALVSSMEERATSIPTVYIGEVGLNGELRPAGQLQERINEALKLGFKKIIVPKSQKNFETTNRKITLIRHINELL